MDRRDYILRIIEQAGQVLIALREIILDRVAGPGEIDDQLRNAAARAGLDLDVARLATPDTLALLVAPNGEVEPARCWLYAESLYLDGLSAELAGQRDHAWESYHKARLLYSMVKPWGGQLVGWPEAAERMAEIDRRLEGLDDGPGPGPGDDGTRTPSLPTPSAPTARSARTEPTDLLRRTRDAALVILVAGGASGCGSPAQPPLTGTSPAGLYFDMAGTGDPVVLIHGFSLDHRMWNPQVQALVPQRTVIRYDLRGHGASAGISGPYSAVEDLRDLLDHLDIRRAALVGLSAGAQVAVDFALSHPERVERLVLAAPGLSGFVPQGPFDWMQPVVAAAGAGDPAAAAILWAETPLMAMADHPAADSLMRTMVVANASLWSHRSNPERPLSPPAVARLSEIRVPTLILIGELDMADVQRVADTLAAGVAGSVRRVVPGAGHLINLMAPEAFTAAVASFLATKRSDPS
jgi:3-oxoadipate enol-lactonase